MSLRENEGSICWGGSRFALLLCGLCISSSAAWAQDRSYPIAGVNPDQRPAGAPVITKFTPPKDFEKIVFFGIEGKPPQSLEPQLKDQGAWFTPFDRPGMLPPYDLRGWHKK